MAQVFIEILAYGLIGILAGVMAGLLGISGGLVTVPGLLLVFHFLGFPQGYVMQLAIGTSLAAMVFNSISSTWAHQRRQSVLWDLFLSLLPGIVLGSIAGASIAHLISGVILEVIFGIFAILVGLHFLRPTKVHDIPSRLPSKIILGLIGFGIGGISNILGIGGGIITVPVLLAFHIQDKKAIATSAATGLIISFLGALSYLYFGIGETSFSYTVGYLYLPAFVIISITTFFAAPYGAHLTHILPTSVTKRIFGIALMGTGVLMLFI